MDGTFRSYRQPDGTFRSYQGASGYYQDRTGYESISSQNSWFSGQETSEEGYSNTDNTSAHQYHQPLASVYQNHHGSSPHASINQPPVYEQYFVPSIPSISIPTQSAPNYSTVQAVEWTELDTRSGRRLSNWYTSRHINQGDANDETLRVALGAALAQGEDAVSFLDETLRVRRCKEPMKHDKVCNAVLVLPPNKRSNPTWETLQCYRCHSRRTMAKSRS
jgi:hypothetical protein